MDREYGMQYHYHIFPGDPFALSCRAAIFAFEFHQHAGRMTSLTVPTNIYGLARRILLILKRLVKFKRPLIQHLAKNWQRKTI